MESKVYGKYVLFEVKDFVQYWNMLVFEINRKQRTNLRKKERI